MHVIRVLEHLWRPAEERADRDEVPIDRVIEAALIEYGIPTRMTLRPGVGNVSWLEGEATS